MKKTLFIGSDHAGFELKNQIIKYLFDNGYKIEDLGPYVFDPEDDYSDFALKVCKKVLGSNGKGILVCGTGQGMDRVANKITGIYAAVCWDKFSALVAKQHGDVNVLCVGARSVSLHEAKDIITTWLEESFSGDERHIRRINKIKEIEKSVREDKKY